MDTGALSLNIKTTKNLRKQISVKKETENTGRL